MSEVETARATMRAWAIDAYGGPERMQIRRLPVPEPGPGDVLIEMSGAEVGDWDIVVREGEWPMGRPFPLVLGLAGAGAVAALGGELDGFAERDRVYAYNYPSTATAPGPSSCSRPRPTSPARPPRSN